jgi:hypothetical protein
MSLRKLFKSRGLAINMIACLAFLALAVYGWGLPVKELLHYFLITLICLVIVVGLALLAGFLLRKFTNKHDE